MGNYYVRKTGLDSNDGTSSSTAFLTINKAFATSLGGDTVYVGAGTYVGDLTNAKPNMTLIGDTTGINTGDNGFVTISNDYAQFSSCSGVNFTVKNIISLCTLNYALYSSANSTFINCIFKSGHGACFNGTMVNCIVIGTYCFGANLGLPKKVINCILIRSSSEIADFTNNYYLQPISSNPFWGSTYKIVNPTRIEAIKNIGIYDDLVPLTDMMGVIKSNPLSIGPLEIGFGLYKTDIQNMEIGDYIPCRYTATSGIVGTFSELGTCSADEIPLTGTTTPNGLFNFIKVDKGTLIADRNIQTGISWDSLNAGKYIEGRPFTLPTKLLPDSISASNFRDPYLPTSLIDGNTSGKTTTGWWTDSGHVSNEWVLFSYNLPITINNILIENGYSDYAVKNFKIQISEDGMIFTDVYTGVLSRNDGLQKFSFDKCTSKYIRIFCIDTYTAGYFTLSEIQFYDYTLDKPQIRSLTGGVAYIDSNGNSSTTNNNLGAFPSCNEWDKYIVNSDLDGKITKGDDNVWHWSNVQYGSLCKDTPIPTIGANTYRILRGATVNGLISWASSTPYSIVGFRPVLNYLETDSKATNLFY